MMYATKGEMVFCQNGHEVGKLTRDLAVGTVIMPEIIEGVENPLSDPMPSCKICGAQVGVGYWRDGKPVNSGLYFREGFRLHNGATDKIEHYEKHPDTWPTRELSNTP